MGEIMTPQEILALKKEIFSSLHCAMPGTVVSFDTATQTASVRPALKRSDVSLPVIRDVPVFFPGSRESAVTWPVSEGDECLLVFADFDIDRWFETGSAEEPASDRQHGLPDAFAFVGFRSRGNVLGDFPGSPRFFDGSVPAHNHDDRYFTESEVTTKLSGKSDTGHKHAAGDITSGTLALGRGGSGVTGVGSTATVDEIATAESGVSITTAQYAWWGKVAMIRLVVKKTAAVSSGTTTLCTVVSGKRPKYNAAGVWAWNKTAQVLSSGKVQVNGAITAGASLTILATYVLA